MCRLGELPAGEKVKIDGCWYVVKDQQENKTFLEQVGFCNSYEAYIDWTRIDGKTFKEFVDEEILGKKATKDDSCKNQYEKNP